MSNIARILCANLITQYNTIYNATPVKISVKSWNKPPQCISFVNMVNAITAAIERPFEFDFPPMNGLKIDGKWQGIIGQVANNHSDLAIGVFSATYDLFDSILISPPLGFSSPFTIMTGKLYQSALHNELHVFTTFSTNVWIALLFSIFFIALSYQFLEPNSSFSFTSLLLSMLLFLKSILAQGVDKHSHVKSFKNFILVGTSILSFNVLIQCFISVMLANLVIDPQIIIDTIKDLTDFLYSTNNNISLIVSKNYLPFTQYVLKTSDRENFPKISEMITTSTNADRHPGTVINDIVHGKSIWINFSKTLEFILMANQHSGLQLSQQYFGTQDTLIYSKKIDIKIKNKIDQVTYSLFESGLQRFWYRLAYRKIKIKIIDPENIISLLHTRGFFILILSIHIILFLVFLMELCFHKLS